MRTPNFSNTNSLREKRSRQNQSGAAEAWWAHNPQVPGSKPGSDKFSWASAKSFSFFFFLPNFSAFSFPYVEQRLIMPGLQMIGYCDYAPPGQAKKKKVERSVTDSY
ncbi:hypothetical protein PR202_ga02594 [Eleusine coracana subsp. coracana]|uniref:Uncharacterized protein n=1 Tax=Eleusine coracana subsp. coracana TaxID=191504 RepID=A0AAV5BN60_ELECO|nr:hypothetical protein PR202_ga02594 [Eleusine coracana subsp. coracana]